MAADRRSLRIEVGDLVTCLDPITLQESLGIVVETNWAGENCDVYIGKSGKVRWTQMRTLRLKQGGNVQKVKIKKEIQDW